MTVAVVVAKGQPQSAFHALSDAGDLDAEPLPIAVAITSKGINSVLSNRIACTSNGADTCLGDVDAGAVVDFFGGGVLKLLMVVCLYTRER